MVTKSAGKTKVPPCPITRIMNVIGGKWKPMIIYNLLSGTKRFNELQRLSGNPSARVLTLQLRELENDKIISRRVFDQIPPRVEYSLTTKGKSLNLVMEMMAQWGKAN
ncbi:helix-turn-helix transcriptional regulator [Bdellovibrio sp. SKB1291214]|uniref:winged helix-turn-helix transcriptional regulator n=1 Tax=Bdellovibrio sp. SKB1291214 TaxID=1732569 RepID=UPI000B51BE34|nr:helix-turn-helix domain-containing protein [Bdellovibrio sp. SKB1291214]UYL08546.1 helix-turn-helix transcriptional regulator [Bdellovibrio sp. SKB1291214]